MVNILRMDLYRLVRSKSFWIGLAVSIGLALFSIFSIWFMSSAGYTQMLQDASDSGFSFSITDSAGTEWDQMEASSLTQAFSQMDVLQYLGGLLLNGGLVTLLALLVIALFISGDFETGFSKNVFSVKQRRTSYFLSKMLISLLIATVYLLGVSAVALMATAATGIELSAVPFFEGLLWVALVLLILLAYALLVSLVVWVFRSRVAAVVVCLLLATGLVGMLIGGFFTLFPPIAFLNDLTLYSQIVALSHGLAGLEAGNIARILAVGVGFSVICSIAGIVALKKKDI